MNDFTGLLLNLQEDLQKGNITERANRILKKIVSFYIDNLNVRSDEVAIFFTNKQKTSLSFVYPEYLVKSGMIPVDSPEAIVSQIFRTGKSFISNKFLEKEHLSIFEFIKPPNTDTKLIWKLIGALIVYKNDKIGVIEISKRRANFEDVRSDFTSDDLKFLEQSIVAFAPILKTLCDEIFKAKRARVKQDLGLLAEIVRWRRNVNDGDCVKIRASYLGMLSICKGHVAHKYSIDKIEIKISSGKCKEFMTVAIDSLWPCYWNKNKMNRVTNIYQKLKKLSKIVNDGT